MRVDDVTSLVRVTHKLVSEGRGDTKQREESATACLVMPTYAYEIGLFGIKQLPAQTHQTEQCLVW